MSSDSEGEVVIKQEIIPKRRKSGKKTTVLEDENFQHAISMLNSQLNTGVDIYLDKLNLSIYEGNYQ